VLGVSVRRPAAGQLPSRTSAALRRRIVLGILVLLSLALITVSFREGENGPLRSVQDAAATALMPFEVAVERVARPFRDAWAWFDGLLGAKDEAERLRKQNEALLQEVIQNQFAANEGAKLKALLDFKEGPTFPRDFEGLAAAVTSRPPIAYAQEIVVAVGASHGVEKFAPVVTDKGLVGVVTTVYTRSSRVRLLTDEQSSVSAKDARTGAAGIVRHGPGVGSTLRMERVPKENRVRVGDTIVTAGWRSSRLESIYPPGIPIGRVTSVGQTNTDLYKQVQVEPLGDFTSLDAVLVLVPKEQP
jgi:rod shape-determining protein MreC